MSELKVVVVGAAGRMGRELLRIVAETEGTVVAGALEREDAPQLGQDAGDLAGIGPIGVKLTDDPLPVFAAADAVLDFTTPEATIGFAEIAAQARIVHVVGTTGLAVEDHERLDAAARHAVIIQSGNMSLGVNLLALMVRQAARALDADFDIEIVEMHHRHKVDAPSGTALLLGEAAAAGRGVELARHSIRIRDGHTGARHRGDIGFATSRGGSVVGEHRVMLAGDGEMVELSHRAFDRAIFARGAVRAALWGRGRKPGRYTMEDVLGLAGA